MIDSFKTKRHQLPLRIFLWIWQLPQNILGIIVLLSGSYVRKTLEGKSGEKIVYFFNPDRRGSITLGEYRFLDTNRISTVRHEYGHTRQSRMLGPLYLIFIGLNSLMHAWLHDCEADGKEYGHFWTERWADKLGGQ